jgi:hypothetical protein
MARRVLGVDGKSYPEYVPAEQRARIAGRVHYLSHAEGLSVRQIVARLEADHGIRRSVGWVSTTLRTKQCIKCSGVSNART